MLHVLTDELMLIGTSIEPDTSTSAAVLPEGHSAPSQAVVITSSRTLATPSVRSLAASSSL